MLWTKGTLEVYLREGRIEIDNNLVENAIRICYDSHSKSLHPVKRHHA